MAGSWVEREREREASERFRDAIRIYRADVDSISGLEPDELRTVRGAVRAATARLTVLRARTRTATVHGLIGSAGLAIVTFAVGVALARDPTRASRQNGYWGAFEVVGALAALIAMSSPTGLRRLASWRARGSAPTESTMVPMKQHIEEIFESAENQSAAVAAGICAVVTVAAFDHNPLTAQVTFEATALGVALGLAFAIVSNLASRMVIRSETRHITAHAFDPALPALLRCIAEMRRLAPVWDRPDVARYLIHRIEAVAQTAGQRTPRASRAPLSDPGLRTAIRQPDASLGQILRAHKQPIAVARTREEFDKVADSLTTGLLAMASKDWKALFANAPEPRKRWMTSYALTHLLPAAVLGVAALVLPLVPPFRHSTLPTASIRVSLAAFAVLRLIPGPSLTDLVDKGLSRGFDAGKKG